MRRLQQRRSIAKFLCFLMILEMFVASPNVAEASVSKTISKNGREYCAVEGNKQTITVTLASPNKPENTKVVSSSVPSWASVSKPNYNSPVFMVTVQQNNGSGSRVENIEFTDGTNSWTLTLTQYVYKAPTTTPPTKPVTKEPTKKAPTPTKAPTSTPTPTPELTASEASLGFPADGATKTVTISGHTGTLRADRNDTWFTVSVSGGTISVTATKNTSTARASYVDVTDTGSGRSVRIQVTQAAPIYNPEPTKAPTNTPTPTPAETLPVKTKKLQFGAQGGQSTITLDEKTYNLRFSYPDNPSVPTGWVTMSYENGKIIVKVKQNKDYISLSMKVKITDTMTNQYAYVTINQKAAPKPTPTPTPYLSANRNEISFDDKGGSDTITLAGVRGEIALSYDWITNGEKDWAHAIYDGKSVKLTVDQNKSINPRTVTLTITDATTKKTVSIAISQEAMPNTTVIQMPVYVKVFGVNMLHSNLYSYEEHNEVIEVSGNSGNLQFFYEWEPETQTNWVQMVFMNGVIKMHMNENRTSDPREVKIKILDEVSRQSVTVIIKQAPADPSIPLAVAAKTLEWSIRAIKTAKAIEYLMNWDIAKASNMAPDDLVALVMALISTRFDPTDENREKNKSIIYGNDFKLDLEVGKGYINGQERGEKAGLKFGGTSFAKAGCGIIACYNALNHFGMAPKEMAILRFIECFERNGYIMNLPPVDDKVYKLIYITLKVAQSKQPNNQALNDLTNLFSQIVEYGANHFGGCGVNPYKIDDALAKYGLKTKTFQTKKGFINSVQNALKSKTHKCYIVDFWNGQGGGTGHFVFIETDESSGWIKAYNWEGDDMLEESISLYTLEETVGDGNFLIAYEVYK